MSREKIQVWILKNIWYILLGAIGGIGITILLYILGFFDKKDLEIIKVCISLAAVFATFGGAYLGAKISADNARNLEELKRKREVTEQNKKIVHLIKMNLDNISDVHIFICNYYLINQNEFLMNLKRERKNFYDDNNRPIDLEKRGNIKFLESYMAKWSAFKDWNNPIIKEIDDFKGLCEEVSSHIVNFENHQINTIYQLKQILPKVKKYIIFNVQDQNYTIKKGNTQEFEEFKGYFMLFSILYIDLVEDILDINLSD
ncbi:hypothetical protein [Staphylococcus saprophyticus]|uniref:hypothetical protein n=1 Tax=Staphylococcus saprophyticus TaxID=29385 RepID=UPI001888EE5B|nr:hypothetical protein [Staphylococcus saprophyticus]MBF2779943.1 hypothetical protein [Staphylococcus saprophyticus]